LATPLHETVNVSVAAVGASGEALITSAAEASATAEAVTMLREVP